MKVKCKKIINEHTGKEQKISPVLKIGKEYIILSIEVCMNKVFYLFSDDDINQHPHLHDAKQFEITSHLIPSNWEINPNDLHIVNLGPKSWEEPEFWERCFDGDKTALGIYKKEAVIIYQEEGAFD